MRRTLSAALALLAATSIHAHADATSSAGDNQWVLIGSGSASCGAYSVAFQQSPSYKSGLAYQGQQYFSGAGEYAAWIAGYVTAYNLLSRKPGHNQVSLDMEGITMAVRKVCDENPTARVIDAVSAVIKKL